MATFLRPLSYQFQWLYTLISRVAALSVGGEQRFHHLPLMGLDLPKDVSILDLCCGSGQATRYLVELGRPVTGLDASPLSICRAQKNVPEASFVEGWAESMPFEADTFGLVHSSAAMHEMQLEQRKQIFEEVFRVLKPGGTFVLIDFHQPDNPIFWSGLALFLWLFETETSWQMLHIDLQEALRQQGFRIDKFFLKAGGSLQIVQATKPALSPK